MQELNDAVVVNPPKRMPVSANARDASLSALLLGIGMGIARPATLPDGAFTGPLSPQGKRVKRPAGARRDPSRKGKMQGPAQGRGEDGADPARDADARRHPPRGPPAAIGQTAPPRRPGI
jgi:hypothetical protein